MRPGRAARVTAALLAAAVVTAACSGDDGPGPKARRSPPPPEGQRSRFFATNDPVQRACDLPARHLVRIWRGYYGTRSQDITLVPQAPNFPGGFQLPSHSGPWAYLQRVPLVLYGPRRISAAGRITRPASIVDVYPTVGELLGVPLEPRAGEVLGEALKQGIRGAPRIVVTVVWDGVGRNVLRRWPDAWPTLARLEREGTSYLEATVGSSPSITPATHSSLGTGAYPNDHGITAIPYRNDEGIVVTAFEGKDPTDLMLTTFADQIDPALGNRPRVGLLGWTPWHMGMLGHGAQTPGGDFDELALIGEAEGEVVGNPELYATPSYLPGFPGLEEYAARLDRSDGEADEEWMGHALLEDHDNPAWVRYESDMLIAMLRRSGYGSDATPDLLFVNFKPTDIVGHLRNMDSKEMEATLRAQDDALARLVGYLDREVRDYVVILTSDHGHVPSPERTGGWAVGNGEVARDIDDHFGAPKDRSLTQDGGSTGFFFNYKLMNELDVTGEEVARFLNGYTIADNNKGAQLPEGYEGRGDEPLFSATIPRSLRTEVSRCAFGAPEPPPSIRA